MEVLSVTDQPDGSAIVELNMTEEENNILIQYAVADILQKKIERIKNEDNLCSTISDPE
jgi:hypothetical protein